MRKVVFFLLVCSLNACVMNRTVSKPIAYYQHEIQYSGETLGQIARWYTGSSSNWRLIQQHNPKINPTALHIGDNIFIPENILVRKDPLPQLKVQIARKVETTPAATETIQAPNGTVQLQTTPVVQEKVIEKKVIESSPTVTVEIPQVKEPEIEPVKDAPTETNTNAKLVDQAPPAPQPIDDIGTVEIKHAVAPESTREKLWDQLLHEE